MNNEDYIKYKNWFYTYTDSFLTSDKDFNYHIILKKDHCLRVAEEIYRLGKSLGLKQEALNLTRVLGLYHDLGRYYQYTHYQTFSDEKSCDHADLGEEIVRKKSVFQSLDDKEKNIIFHAIRFHNKLAIGYEVNEREKFFIRMLRDADKLDIWKVLIKHYSTENKHNNPVLLDLPDTPSISDKVMRAVLNQELVRKEHIKTVNDFIVLNMSWIFDLNFNYTLQQVFHRKYIDTLIHLLPENERARRISAVVSGYQKIKSCGVKKKNPLY